MPKIEKLPIVFQARLSEDVNPDQNSRWEFLTPSHASGYDGDNDPIMGSDYQQVVDKSVEILKGMADVPEEKLKDSEEYQDLLRRLVIVKVESTMILPHIPSVRGNTVFVIVMEDDDMEDDDEPMYLDKEGHWVARDRCDILKESRLFNSVEEARLELSNHKIEPTERVWINEYEFNSGNWVQTIKI